jgi:predicted dehydrogenase
LTTSKTTVIAGPRCGRARNCNKVLTSHDKLLTSVWHDDGMKPPQWRYLRHALSDGNLGLGVGGGARRRGSEAGTMVTSPLRIGIAGCGTAARIHLDRLLAVDAVEIVGCADSDLRAAQALADRAASLRPRTPPGPAAPAIGVFNDHRALLDQLAPDAVCIFTPHLTHYRLAMDALQCGCHLFVEKPLSGNLQEATDIVSLAKSRQLRVGVGHQYRLAPSVMEARRRIGVGTIGPLRLITAVLARPRRADNLNAASAGVAATGMLAEAGDHLIDALLWTTGQVAREVGAFQEPAQHAADLVTAAAIRLADGTPVSLAISGASPGPIFSVDYFGEAGCLRITDQSLEEERTDSGLTPIPLEAPSQTIDGNFVAALRGSAPLCCPAEEALDTVRLFEAIVRSAATNQIVRVM